MYISLIRTLCVCVCVCVIQYVSSPIRVVFSFYKQPGTAAFWKQLVVHGWTNRG